jgi:hypothetical protein
VESPMDFYPDVTMAYENAIAKARNNGTCVIDEAELVVFPEIVSGKLKDSEIQFATKLCLRLFVSELKKYIDFLLDLADGSTVNHGNFPPWDVDSSVFFGKKLIQVVPLFSESITKVVVLLECVVESWDRYNIRSSRVGENNDTVKAAFKYLRDYCIQTEQAIVELSIRADIPVEKPSIPGRNGGRMSGDYVKQKLADYGKSIKGKSEKELAKIKLEQVMKETGLKKSTAATSATWKAIAEIKKKNKRASVGAMSKETAGKQNRPIVPGRTISRGKVH